MNRLHLRLAGVMLFLGIVGCGGDGRPRLVQATGTITLNGEPLAGAIVGFQVITEDKGTYQRPSSAVTDAAGKFSLGTYGTSDGAPPGKYRVAIQKREVVGQLPADFNSEMDGSLNITYRWVTPRELADPSTSNLTAAITLSGIEPATFELQSSSVPEIEKTGPQSRAD